MKKHLFIKIFTLLSLAILIICIIILISQLNGCEERTPGYTETVVYPTTTEAETEPDEPYVSPIDWEELKEQNEDIYAWLYIPGTKISYPILQREADDKYYLSKDSNGNYYYGGAIMTESFYNTKTFEDPVTILYGHNMRSGAMFGTLQSNYSSQSGFDEHREIIVYMPDKELHYKVWAALPFSSEHLMRSYHNFENERQFNLFFDDVSKTRSLGGCLDEEMTMSPTDKILVLSTCVASQSSKRFLVISRLEKVEK